MRPAMLIAPSDVPAWLILGDSITQQSWSYGEIALHDMSLPAVKSARGGEGWTSITAGRIEPLLPYATQVIDCYGINVLNGTLQSMVSPAVALWRSLCLGGATTIIKPTLLPSASTSDNWASLGGQTANNTYRVTINNWLRDGAPIRADNTVLDADTADPSAIRCQVVRHDGSITPATGSEAHPLTAVSDAGTIVESSLNSGIYKPEAWVGYGSWSDGLHPAPSVHGLVAHQLATDVQALGI